MAKIEWGHSEDAPVKEKFFIHNPVGSSHVPQSKTGCTIFVFYPEG